MATLRRVWTTIDDFEARLVAPLTRIRSGPTDALWLALSANARFIPLLVIAVAVCRRRRSVWPLVLPLLALAIEEVVVGQLKALTSRTRPYLYDLSVHALGPHPLNGSFPSGHAAGAAAVVATLAVLEPRVRWPLALYAFLIGCSRVVLGVHYPSDVIAGWALGAAIGLAVAATQPNSERRIRKPS